MDKDDHLLPERQPQKLMFYPDSILLPHACLLSVMCRPNQHYAYLLAYKWISNTFLPATFWEKNSK